MPNLQTKMFFLGNFADMDTNESDYVTNTPNTILGTYVQPDLVDIEVQDTDSNNIIYDDDIVGANEFLTYDAGGGSMVEAIDSTLVYNITVTLWDGSTTNMLGTVVQMQNGDVFLTDYANNGSLDNLSLQNISLNSLHSDGYNGFFANSSVDNTNVVCFTKDAQVQTTRGSVPVSRLRVGDAVNTLNHGPQSILWIGSHLHLLPGKHAPIRIQAGALGDGAPNRTLRISPQHRLLVSSMVAERMFGAFEVFVAAKSLLGMPGVQQEAPNKPVSYWHLACRQHEVIQVNGTFAETLYLGAMAERALSDVEMEELNLLLGDTQSDNRTIAHPCPPMRRQKKLLQRMFKDKQATQLQNTQP